MLKYYNYDIVFQEYPDEVTLAINLTMCPNRCVGCHSAYLREDIGEELTHERLTALIDSYDGTITCVGIQGGDNDPEAVLAAGRYIKQHYEGRLRTGWYSGRTWLPDAATLSSPTTNQRFCRVEADGTLTDMTQRFKKKGVND